MNSPSEPAPARSDPQDTIACPGERYLVGGAVRDRLLGLPVLDRDWVVVGTTPEAMIDAGFRPVGKDFPVFLHPQTHEEHALARTERKSGRGYHGFVFNTAPDVSLEADLERRDLTINAMAEAADGSIIDPFNGRRDIESRQLRHVSMAFTEDPVRVLRVARFMARFHGLGFDVAEDTLALMRQMVADGEIDALVAERVWQEMERALASVVPSAFFMTLRHAGALERILPEVDALFGVPQSPRSHPEIDSGVHTMMVLDEASSISDDVEVRLAALCHDLGKATTPKSEWPKHKGHEARSALITQKLGNRLRIPKRMLDAAVIAARYHTHCHRVDELRNSTLAKLLYSLDVLRKPERFEGFLTVCKADSRGRLGFENTPYPQAETLCEAAAVFSSVDAAAIAREIDDKSEVSDQVLKARTRAIAAWRQELAAADATMPEEGSDDTSLEAGGDDDTGSGIRD